MRNPRRMPAAAAGCLAAGIAVLAALLPELPAQRPTPLVDPRSVAPFVPSPWHVVDRMLEEVGVAEDDLVVDLGSGDGRILLRAALNCGARGIGYEINADLVEEARSAVSAAGVQDRVRFEHKDIFEADLTQATVVAMFLITSANRQLRPKLAEELRPGSRVVCYKWEIPGWNPSKTVTVTVSGVQQPIYIYEIGRHR